MMSRLTGARVETRVDKGLRGHWKNTPSPLSLISEGYFRSRSLELDVSHSPVMFRKEVFSEVIGKVFSYLMQVESKLFLLDVTPHTVEAHVKCFGTFPAHVSSEDAMVGLAVSFYWSGRLRMTHFKQCCADGNSLLAVEEDLTGFSLSDGSHDGADGLVRIGLFGVGLGRMGGRGGVSLR